MAISSTLQPALDRIELEGGLTPPAPGAIRPGDVRPEGLTAHLALEIATGLTPLPQILYNHGVSEAAFEHMRRSPTFQAMLADAMSQIQGDSNSVKRTKLKAAVALEDSVKVLYAIAHDNGEDAKARIEAVRTMSRLAGLEKDTADVMQRETFSVTINLGGDKPAEQIVLNNKDAEAA